jgi:hypothetical protein
MTVPPDLPESSEPSEFPEPALTVARLRAMTEDQLETRHTLALAREGAPSASVYAAERARRDRVHQTEVVVRLTWIATFIAFFSLVAAVAQVALALR